MKEQPSKFYRKLLQVSTQIIKITKKKYRLENILCELIRKQIKKSKLYQNKTQLMESASHDLTPLNNTIFINMNILLGKGSTGTVYQGIYQSDPIEKPKSIAIKVINMDNITNEVTNYLLHCEIASLKTLSKAKNPFIVRLYDVIYKDRLIYIAMQRLTGKTLREYLNEHNNTLDQETAKQIFLKIVEGYSSISDNKIIHRDLKPENIIFREDNTHEPCIIDFGYCINPLIKEVPKVYYNVGSPRYMAPQSYKKNLYSQKSDIWSLGIIFYEMLVGKTFDQGMDLAQCQQKIMTHGIPFPHNFNPLLINFVRYILNINVKNRLSFQQLRQAVLNDFFIQQNQDQVKSIFQSQQKKCEIVRPRTQRLSYNPRPFRQRFDLTPTNSKFVQKLNPCRQIYENNQLKNRTPRNSYQQSYTEKRFVFTQVLNKSNANQTNSLNPPPIKTKNIELHSDQRNRIQQNFSNFHVKRNFQANVRFAQIPLLKIPNQKQNERIIPINVNTPQINYNIVSNAKGPMIKRERQKSTHFVLDNQPIKKYQPMSYLRESKRIIVQIQPNSNSRINASKYDRFLGNQRQSMKQQGPTDLTETKRNYIQFTPNIYKKRISNNYNVQKHAPVQFWHSKFS